MDPLRLPLSSLAGAALIILLALPAAAVEPESGRTLAKASASLVEAQAQVSRACAAAGVAVAHGLGDVLIVRRTIAADWQRRLDSGAVRADDPALVRFTGELDSLVASLQQLANLVQQLGDAQRRFPHCLDEPAYARYRALVADAVDAGMQAVATGRLRDQVAPAVWYQRQARHNVLLQLIEAGHVADERYASVPRDDHLLIEYREQLLLTRSTLEQTLEGETGSAPVEQQAVLDAYTHLLDARIEDTAQLAEGSLEATAPEVVAFQRACAVRIAVLTRQLELARSSDSDGQEQERREAAARRALNRAEHLKEMAAEWLTFESERRTQATAHDEALEQAPAEEAKRIRAVLAAQDEAQRQAQAEFEKARAADDQGAALAAQHAVDRVRQQRDHLGQHLDEDLALSGREAVWRAHAKDPAVAERLRQWDERRAVVLAARHAAEEAEDAAQAALHASQRAELVAEQAQERAAELELASSAHDDDLTDLQQALDEMIDLRGGDAPAVQ